MTLDKIAVFKWEDAAGKTTWRESEEPPSTLFATVCGLFIREDDHSISVGLERFEDGQWRETLTVPKSLIRGKIKYFVVPEFVKTKRREGVIS